MRGLTNNSPITDVNGQIGEVKINGLIYSTNANDFNNLNLTDLYNKGFRELEITNNDTVINYKILQDGSLLFKNTNENLINIFDNSYFINPINQRGETTYPNNTYTIDRWKNYSSSNKGITLTSTGIQLDQGVVDWGQPILNSTFTPGKYYTIIVYLNNGTICAATLKYEGTKYQVNIPMDEDSGLKLNWIYNWIGDISLFAFQTPKQAVTISYVAMYEGSFTNRLLPPYKIPDYTTEYLKCRQYYKALASYGQIVYKLIGEVLAALVQSDQMRILPTAIVGTNPQVFDDATTWTSIAVKSVTWMGDGYKIRFDTSGTISDGKVYIIQSLIGLNADL